MSKCVKAYHNLIKCNNIGRTKESDLDTFVKLLQRFEIQKVSIDELQKKHTKLSKKLIQLFNSNQTIKNLLNADKGYERKLEIIPNSEKVCDKGNTLALRVDDVYEILMASEKAENDWPMILNTLENCYKSISIIGDNQYAHEIMQYFSNNSNIITRHIKRDKIKYIDGKYIVSEPALPDEILLWVDLCMEEKVIDQNGNEIQAVFWKNYYKEGLKTTDYLHDINYSIIPRLLEGGVEVIKVYIPDEERLKRKGKIRRKQYYWKILRKLDAEKFADKRRKKCGTIYLKNEQDNLVNNNEKGYSEVYGNGKYINFDNGFRRTIGNKPEIAPSIYIFGPCFVRGTEVEDKDTIASQIKNYVGSKYNVYNYGSEFHTCNYIMRTLEYHKGDIVILFSSEMKWEDTTRYDGVHYMDLTDTYNSIDEVQNHLYDMLEHFDMTVQNKIIKDLIQNMEQNHLLNPADISNKEKVIFGAPQKRIPDIKFSKDSQFISWLRQIENQVNKNRRTGAIVMNCNPFTNGHRYLIEYAATQVEQLIIFVVQEDKSVFPFADRFQLVKEGTADLKNVLVVPSGNYMISSMTLPGYFEKENLADMKLDASNDLMLFLQIANTLGISVRFAGEEPLDPFTRQYNENMSKILPKYGLEFHVIKRKEEDGEVISASRVRRALKNNEFELIRQLVPECTYRYLEKRDIR